MDWISVPPCRYCHYSAPSDLEAVACIQHAGVHQGAILLASPFPLCSQARRAGLRDTRRLSEGPQLGDRPRGADPAKNFPELPPIWWGCARPQSCHHSLPGESPCLLVPHRPGLLLPPFKGDTGVATNPLPSSPEPTCRVFPDCFYTCVSATHAG